MTVGRCIASRRWPWFFHCKNKQFENYPKVWLVSGRQEALPPRVATCLTACSPELMFGSDEGSSICIWWDQLSFSGNIFQEEFVCSALFNEHTLGKGNGLKLITNFGRKGIWPSWRNKKWLKDVDCTVVLNQFYSLVYSHLLLTVLMVKVHFSPLRTRRAWCLTACLKMLTFTFAAPELTMSTTFAASLQWGRMKQQD